MQLITSNVGRGTAVGLLVLVVLATGVATAQAQTTVGSQELTRGETGDDDVHCMALGCQQPDGAPATIPVETPRPVPSTLVRSPVS
jgi:hypothetical protein